MSTQSHNDLEIPNISAEEVWNWVESIYRPLVGFQDANTYFEKLRFLKNYYQVNEQKILELAAKSHRKSICTYPVDWVRVLTPIEFMAWESMRCYGTMFYPQYPILTYFCDFVNPGLKIILELDGKDFHNKEKDQVRDGKLARLGWTVFRITGKEMYRIDFKNQFTCEEEGLNEDETREAIEDWICNTGDGVIKAIHTVYFIGEPAPEYRYAWEFYNLCKYSLSKHQSA